MIPIKQIKSDIAGPVIYQGAERLERSTDFSWDNVSKILTLGSVGLAGQRLQIITTDGSTGWMHSTNVVNLLSYISSNRALIGTNTNHDLGFTTNALERMTIAANGNVGIGATPNTEKLYVYSSATAFAQFGGSFPTIMIGASNYLQLNAGNIGETLLSGLQNVQIRSNGYTGYVSASGFGNLYSYNFSDNAFRSYIDSGDGVNRFIINHGGAADNRLGVGISLPTATIHAKGIDSTASNYVFKVDNTTTNILSIRNDGVSSFNNGDLNIYTNAGVSILDVANYKTFKISMSGSYGDFITLSHNVGDIRLHRPVVIMGGITPSGNNTVEIGLNGGTSSVGVRNISLGTSASGLGMFAIGNEGNGGLYGSASFRSKYDPVSFGGLAADLDNNYFRFGFGINTVSTHRVIIADGLNIYSGSVTSISTYSDLTNSGTNRILGIDNTGKLFNTDVNPDAINTGTIGITIDGSGSVITTGFKQYVVIPYNCVITDWYIIADVVGSIVIDVWKDTSIPTVSNTIAGSEKPTLSSQQNNSDNNLTTWTTTVTAGDIIGFNVDSVSTITKATLVIKIRKT